MERDDEAVRERLAAAYSAVGGLDQARVVVRGGLVRLEGAVDSSDAASQAAAIATAVPGVLYVHNLLEVRDEVGSRLAPLVERVQQWPARLVLGLPLLILTLIVVAAFVTLARVVLVWSRPFARLVDNPLVRQLVQRLTATLVILIGVLVVLELLDASTLAGALLGTAGVVGIAAGFALRDIAENYLAGMFLALQRPFAANDHLLVGGREGRVIRMTSRETVLMTLDGNHLRIPNATVFKEVITNYTRNPLRRLEFAAGIGVREDLTRVQHVALGCLRRIPGIVESPPPFSRVESLDDWSVSVHFFAWMDQRGHDFGKVRSEAIRRTKVEFDAAGIDMPSPSYGVTVARSGVAPAVPPRRPAAEGTQATEVTAATTAHEVEVDFYLEQQIADDRQRSSETDLLASEPSGTPPPAPRS
jgi:small-conductance mechanosensitive channel